MALSLSRLRKKERKKKKTTTQEFGEGVRMEAT